MRTKSLKSCLAKRWSTDLLHRPQMLSFTIYDCCGFLCVSQVVSPANSVYASNTKDLWDCYWCEFSFVFRRLARVKAFLHPSHTKHITSVESFVFLQDTHLCICKEPAWINALLHISHTHTKRFMTSVDPLVSFQKHWMTKPLAAYIMKSAYDHTALKTRGDPLASLKGTQ